jgi:hypothetical protein
MVVSCLTVGATGCKSGMSMPGSNWLSWGKKPSPTTLSSTAYPQKPSTNAVPGGPTGLASYPTGSQSQRQAPAGSGSKGYYTGPYGTGGQTPSQNSPSGYGQANYGKSVYGQASYGQNSGYGQASRDTQGSGTQFASGGGQSRQTMQAAGPYKSPYQSQTATAPPATYPNHPTADARNSYLNNAGSTTTTSGSTIQLGTQPGGAGGYSPTNLQQPKSSYPTTPAAQPASYPSTSTYGGSNGYSSGASNAATSPATGLTQSGGPYRPGSTGRNSRTLPTAQPQTTATANPATSPQGTAYPTTANANYGGYPTTGQY